MDDGQGILRLLSAALTLAALGGCSLEFAGSGGTSGSQPQSILGLFAPPSPAVAAAWSVDPYDADKRFRGTLMLANAPFGGEPVYVALYENALNDDDSRVRSAAVRGLALHGQPEHVLVIMPFLTHEDRLLRLEAARALQRLHNPVAVPALLRTIEQPEGLADQSGEPEVSVRAEATIALGQYAEGRVLDGLIGALGDRDLAVNRAARDSLRTLTGQDFGMNIRAWVAWNSTAAERFAGQSRFTYPVFNRGRRGLEWIVPFMEPPNEVAATPIGMPDPFDVRSDEAGDLDGESVRNN